MLNSLETDRREALILTQMLGYTYAEAAKIANVRTGTIRSRVARARADLVDMQQAQQARQDRQQAEANGPTRPGRRLGQA